MRVIISKPTAGRSPLTTNKGVTLLEVLVAVAVIAIIGGIAIWSSQGIMEVYRVRGAARQIYADMQMARLKAIKEGKDWAVEFIAGSQTNYCVKRRTGANWDAGCDIGGEDTSDEVVKTVNLASDYAGIAVDPANLTNTLETANERAVFYPNGTAVGGSLTVSGTGRTVTITVNTNTGNIRM